ncbi:MAG: GMC family oxidoreductase N-terminal domain-containing protein [Sandaracinus sp.]
MRAAYDTVIVGAGSAGCVIAARMTESSAHDVLLVEAGPDHGPSARPPDLADGTRNSYRAHDWGHAHRASEAATFRVPMPRGRVVGGSSAVNTCIALRGVPADYDEWAARGLPSWSWARVRPAFLRLERDLDAIESLARGDGRFDAREHGLEGPLPIRRAAEHELTPWQRGFRDACVARGFAEIADHNAEGALGVGPHPRNAIDGVRVDAARAWLTAEVRARANLTIAPHTHVHRVCVARGRVTGVELEHHGVVKTIAARRVILTAGALATPGILLRSGLGPASELSRLGVRRVADVPAIGARLLDHPGTAIFAWPTREGLADTSAALVQIALRLRSAKSCFDGDLQLQAGSYWFFPIGAGLSIPGVGVMMHVGKPVGTGTIRYADAHPHTRPTIDSRLFSEPADRAVALEGLTLARELMDTPPLRGTWRAVWPRPHTLGDRAALEALLPSLCDSGYHPSGTVPMGEACDEFGRIAGLEGLHVADASLLPTIPTANIHLAVLMIGERFGAWLRDGRTPSDELMGA